ncbi:MAG: HAD family hydrolase [Deltaproteobacteria bacterium]|nr:HAD family hydrolase [Deltaproteobacteria bacterium]MBW2362249.1 HAD family hydrolase [Deltaproteobacteria bacterium]
MSEKKAITAISFDGDETLWDFQKVMRHSLAIVLGELRSRVPGEASEGLNIDKMIEIRNAVAAELRGKTVNLEEVRFQAFKRTLQSIGCADDALARDLNARYLENRFEDIELYPDVIPALDSLRDEFTLGLLSNGNGYPEHCGLPERFSFVVFSQDAGAEKPETEIFSVACRQAGCAPAELMHVGDSLASDVSGANAVGAVSVWLNRENVRNDTDVLPDHEIQSLAALAELVKN